MDGAGLDSRYGRYLDEVPAVTLATVNMMSLFGLHRAMRGALVGHFAPRAEPRAGRGDGSPGDRDARGAARTPSPGQLARGVDRHCAPACGRPDRQRRRCRRWLVSHSGKRWLRRQRQIATMKRSQTIVEPSASRISTGPSMRRGPSGTMMTRRRTGEHGRAAGTPGPGSFDAVGTDHHQILIPLSGTDQPHALQPIGPGPHHRPERLLTPRDHRGLHAFRAQAANRARHAAQARTERAAASRRVPAVTEQCDTLGSAPRARSDPHPRCAPAAPRHRARPSRHTADWRR
jgi:hypothetical protein